MKEILVHAFYFLGVLFVLYEFYFLHRLINNITDDDSTKKVQIATILYFAWLTVGIFSSQWIFFYIIIILGVAKSYINYGLWNFFDFVISIVLIIFILLNKYHYQYDLQPYRQMLKIININF